MTRLNSSTQVQQRFRGDQLRVCAQERTLGDREQGIAGVDRLRISPDSPDRGAVASVRAAILDVIVDQREIMKQLDCGGQWGGRCRIATNCRATEECQLRADSFALDRQPGWGVGWFTGGIDPAQMEPGHASEERRLTLKLVERYIELMFEKRIEILLRSRRGVNDAFLLSETV